jgi:RHS repeat-associated protein
MTSVRYTTIHGEVIAEKRNGARRLYTPDPLGSTVALLDNTQTQVDTFTYWPYGEVRTSTGTTPPPFQFVGTKGYYAGSASKAYVRARYLDTPKGRWLTQDPISFLGGDANLYRDVSNNPIVSTDPWGLQSGLDPAPEQPPTRKKPPFSPPPGQMWCDDIHTRVEMVSESELSATVFTRRSSDTVSDWLRVTIRAVHQSTGLFFPRRTKISSTDWWT